MSNGSTAYNQVQDNVLNNYFPNLMIYSVDVVDISESGDDIYIEVLTDRTNDNLDQVYEYMTGYEIKIEDGSFKIVKYTDL